MRSLKAKIFSVFAVILCLSTVVSLPVSAAKWESKWITDNYTPVSPDEYAYTIALVPDTQTINLLDTQSKYNDKKTSNDTYYMDTLYQWLLDNKESQKIELVIGLGDIVDRDWAFKGTPNPEWENAAKAIKKLDGKIPYVLTRGNHDNDFHSKQNPINGFNYYFNGERGEAYTSSLTGIMTQGRSENAYKTITICGVNYLILMLDYAPTDAMLDWANGIVSAHPDHRVIVATHGYLSYSDGELGKLQGGTEETPNLGVEIWEKLVSKHKNIFMVVCGHIGCDNTIVWKQSLTTNRTKVTEIVANPQYLDIGEDLTVGFKGWKDNIGNRYSTPEAPNATGLVALLHFSNDGSYIFLEYYSTIQNKYRAVEKTTIKITPTGTEINPNPATTTAEATEAPVVEETTAAEEKGGCGSSLVTVAMAMPVVMTASVFTLRKKEK